MKKYCFAVLFVCFSVVINAQSTEAQLCQQQIEASELLIKQLEDNRKQIADPKVIAEIDKMLVEARRELKKFIDDCTKKYGYRQGSSGGNNNQNNNTNNGSGTNNGGSNGTNTGESSGEWADKYADIQNEPNARIRQCETANLSTEKVFMTEMQRFLGNNTNMYQPCRAIYVRSIMTAQFDFALDRIHCEAVRAEEHLKEMRETQPDNPSLPEQERKVRCMRQTFIPAYQHYRDWYLNTALSWYEKEMAKIEKMKVSKSVKSDEISERQAYLGKIIVESNQKIVQKMFICKDGTGASTNQVPTFFFGMEAVNPCFTQSGDEIIINKKLKEKLHDNPIEVFKGN